jgi:galactan 5-O-arabinofuranosyltransferase
LTGKRIPDWAVIGASVLTAAFGLWLGSRPIFVLHPVSNLFPQTWLILTFFLIFAGYAVRGGLEEKSRSLWAAGLLSAFLIAALAFIFRGTPFGLNGVSGDAGFQSAMIVKFARFWRYVDFSYRGLPAFYPSFMQYISGKMAALFGIEPFKMAKLNFLAVAFVFPLLSFVLWRKILGERPAAFVTVLFGLAESQFLIWKPFEFVTLVLFSFWWLFFIEEIDTDGREKPRGWKTVLAGGLLGGLVIVSFYYWLIPCFLFLAVRFVAEIIRIGKIRPVFARYRSRVFILAASGFFSAPYWLPLLISCLRYGCVSLQNRFFHPSMVSFPLPLDLSFQNALKWAGIIGISILARSRREARVLLGLILLCLFWYLAGYVGILIGSPLLHVKMNEFLSLLLIISFAATARAVWESRPSFRPAVSAVLAAVILGTFLGYGQASLDVKDSPMFARALEEKVPREFVGNPAVAPLLGKVWLTDDSTLKAYIPIFYFVNRHAHYNHPAARFDERLKMLSLASLSSRPEFLAWILAHNEFDRVDVVSLKDLTLRVNVDNFPQPQDTRQVIFAFKTAAFGSPFFESFGAMAGVYLVHDSDPHAFRLFDTDELVVAFSFAAPGFRDEIRSVLCGRLGEAKCSAILQRTEALLKKKNVGNYSEWAEEFLAAISN